MKKSEKYLLRLTGQAQGHLTNGSKFGGRIMDKNITEKQIEEFKKHLKLLNEEIDMFPAISLRETTYRDKARWAWNEITLLLIQIAGE